MTSRQKPKDVDRELDKLQDKLSVLFEHVQSLYDKMRVIKISDSNSVEDFLASSFTIDAIHADYVRTLEQKNNYLSSITDAPSPSYKELMSFEQLYSQIKYRVKQLTKEQNASFNNCDNKAQGRNYKLPRLEMCSFNGDYENWPVFYETFRTVIHENTDLTDGERVQYLIGRLCGQALSICRDVVPSAENYPIIWNALVNKYNDKRLLIAAYLDKLISLPAVDCSSPTNLEEFIDKFSGIVSSLKQLNISNLDDLIFIHIGCKKVTVDTVKSFEMSLSDTNKMPTCSEFIEYIRNYTHIMQRAHSVTVPMTTPRKSTPSNNNPRLRSSNNNGHVKTFVNVDDNTKCVSCNKPDHTQLWRCARFLAMSPRERFNLIKRTNACVNCLHNKHQVNDCKSTSRCNTCSRSHHSLLHFGHGDTSLNRYPTESIKNTLPGNSNITALTATAGALNQCVTSPGELQQTTSSVHSDGFNGHCSTDRPVSLCTMGFCTSIPTDRNTKTATSVLIGTAQCHVVNDRGDVNVVRAIVDSASQRDFITTDCCRRLKLPIYPSQHKCVSGVGDVTNPIEGVTCVTLHSRHNYDVSLTLQPLVVNRITDSLPLATIDTAQLDYLDKIPLADSRFGHPSPVDLILGSDLFARILRPKTISRAPEEPVAIETILGFLVSGNAPMMMISSAEDVARSYCTIDDSLNNRMSRFFELEEVPSMSCASTPEEQECERFYRETTRRESQGRYIVSLPFQKDCAYLGDSTKSAERMYLALERKLLRNPTIKQEYDNVFKEYLNKGYLRPIDNSIVQLNKCRQYIIPHHGVVRTDKSTTKLRVVLNASNETTSGLSLNDILYTGPNLQNDLFKILLQFRLLPIAISADIRQMYLRILMNERDWPYQRLLYRFDPADEIQTYEMTRVPFGLCCSPFLAIRTVRQLASDERERFPIAASVAERHIYMDDLATSCLSVEDGAELSDQLMQMFAAGGFELVKFSSNSRELMERIPVDRRVSEAVDFNTDSQLKILGMQWVPTEDIFTFRVTEQPRECTKRIILSVIARLWDLMGFVAPVTLLAKLIVKSLWQDNIDWDDKPPEHVVRLWQNFEAELPLLRNIKLPRHVGVTDDCVVTLLGFADASESAYGGVVYLHVLFPKLGHSSVNLVCAKSRVAPSKMTITVARLELCAALILAKLLRVVIDTYRLSCPVYAFTDSRVALAWIHALPCRWQTFVANRVTQIQENIDPQNFYHIPGKDNPADCLSRGLTPAQLIIHPLWFGGPKFARLPKCKWPIQPFDVRTADDAPEAKLNAMTTIDTVPTSHILYELATRVSSWNKLLRIVIYILRFIKNVPKEFHNSHLDYAEQMIVKALQSVHFNVEIAKAKAGITLSPALTKLNAFIDNGILRVGGRLNNAADLSYDSQHPMLLPRRDHIVNMIIDHYHRKHLHTGPQLLMSLLRQRYWILSARNIVRQRVQKCNTCYKARPTNQFPMMASLPACRVTEAKAFCHTGVDYAGPLSVTPLRGRGIRRVKAYICLFVCLVTKAVHLELSSDLSTPAFLNALKRFIARRGPISVIYSDRGSNFIGAKSYLDNMYRLLDSQEYKDKFANELRENRIEFRYNVASAPHFGGLWEVNVRCVKTHLKKVVGNQLLTFEELLTVLTQIEALLNSRPLSVLSSDPSEPSALTPAHFLVLTPLKSLPAEDISDHTLEHRKRMVDHLVQSFWKRWKIEYLHTLQTRPKWTKPNDSLTKGTIVLLESANSSPLDWPLGVIEQTFPGNDGVVRVVNVRTKSGLYRRPVVKVYPLPTQ